MGSNLGQADGNMFSKSDVNMQPGWGKVGWDGVNGVGTERIRLCLLVERFLRPLINTGQGWGQKPPGYKAAPLYFRPLVKVNAVGAEGGLFCSRSLENTPRYCG